MEKERSTAITVVVIAGIFSIITAIINILPGILRAFGILTGESASVKPKITTPMAANPDNVRTAPMDKLSTSIGDVVTAWAAAVKIRPLKVVVKVGYENLEMIGPLGAKIREILVTSIKKQAALRAACFFKR